MNRNRLAHALLVALLGAVALAGCKKDEPAAVTPPPATDPAPLPPVAAPAPAATARVTGFELGNAVGPDMRVATPMSTFAAGDTITVPNVAGGTPLPKNQRGLCGRNSTIVRSSACMRVASMMVEPTVPPSPPSR